MVKRFIDCDTSDFCKMNSREILSSIKASEGRVIISEIIGALQPALYDVSNAELASAFGADILLLNIFDVYNPVFYGINADKNNIIKEIKRLTGRIVGINLEPVDENQISSTTRKISEGRTASRDTAKKARELGADMVVLTGNPETAVTNSAIARAIREIRDELKDDIIIAAGKMHSSGILNEAGANIINEGYIGELIDAGCDIVLLPAPGTIPGITMELMRRLIGFCHDRNVLTITAIGTSQEGSDEDTIRSIALMCKMAGTDIHHLGDSGYPGIAAPENILSYSIAIRGKRHTYRRMSKSVNR